MMVLRVAFVHIEKTGGQTFSHWFRRKHSLSYWYARPLLKSAKDYVDFRQLQMMRLFFPTLKHVGGYAVCPDYFYNTLFDCCDARSCKTICFKLSLLERKQELWRGV